jgi:hypothetical protein
MFSLSSNPLKTDYQTITSEVNKDATHNGATTTARHDIPEEVFIEKSRLKPPRGNEEPEPVEICDIQTLYRHLERDLERKGYEDALVNPDTSYMEEQILYIKSDLMLLISKIKTYYVGYLNRIKFHIESRQRHLLIETVEELIAHRSAIEEEISIITTIEVDAKEGVGLTQNLILGYKKGFRNGFAAITYNTILSNRSL